MMAALSTVFQGMAILSYFTILTAAMFLESAPFASFAAGGFLFATTCAFLSANLSERRAGIDYMFLFFFNFFMAMPAFVQHRVGTYPWFITPSARLLSHGYALLSAALLSYLLALSLGIRVRQRPASRLPRFPEGTPRFYTQWAWGIALVSLLAVAAAGPGSFLEARFAQSMVREGLNAQFSFIARSISLLAMVMMLFLVRNLPQGALRRQNLAAARMYAPVFLLVNYPPALPRFVLFGVIIALCCPFIDFSRPRNKLWTTACAVPVLLFVFPAIKALGTGELDLIDAVFSPARSVGEYLLRVDFDGFVWVLMTMRYLEQGGDLRWGMNFLGVIFFFVPRVIWPGKPVDTGAIVSSSLGFRYTNVANPLPAEALASFGMFGPPIVFAWVGYFVARVETEGVARGQRLSRLFLHALLMGFIVIIARGALNGVAPQFASAFLAYALMMFVVRNPIAWRAW